MPQEGQRSRVSIALLILNLGIKLACVINAKFWPLYPRETAPVSITENAGWDRGPFWTSMEKIKSHLLPHQSSNLGPLHRLCFEFFEQCRVCFSHIPLSSITANCGSCKLEISNEPGTQWVFPHFVATLLLTVAVLSKQPVLATNQNLGSLFPCKAACSPRSLCTIS